MTKRVLSFTGSKGEEKDRISYSTSSALYTKAKLQHLKPEVWQGFAEDLNRTQRYNLIFIPSSSFGHLINFDSVKISVLIWEYYWAQPILWVIKNHLWIIYLNMEQ